MTIWEIVVLIIGITCMVVGASIMGWASWGLWKLHHGRKD